MNTAAFARPAISAQAEIRSVPKRGKWKRSAQRGISIFIVMIVLMLALILVLGGLSIANMNEAIVGNQSEAQRAYASAQALLDAAQRDIRLNGRFCNNAGTAIGTTDTNSRFPANGVATNCNRRFPGGASYQDDFQTMALGAAPGMGNCVNGVCMSNGPDDINFDSSTINQAGSPMQITNTSGASYTNAWLNVLDPTQYGANAAVGGTNLAPSLANGRYWVEVFQYRTNMVAVTGTGNAPVPANEYPFIFRITAMAQGLKGDTVSVLRTYYTPYPMQ